MRGYHKAATRNTPFSLSIAEQLWLNPSEPRAETGGRGRNEWADDGAHAETGWPPRRQEERTGTRYSRLLLLDHLYSYLLGIQFCVVRG